MVKPSFKIRLQAAIIYGLLRFIFATCRCVFLGERCLPKEASVVMFWHSRLAFMGFLYAAQRKRGYSKIPYVLISPHKDGLLISTVMKHFGIQTVQGSSNRSPVRALLEIRKILESGNDVFITPDGPRGPAKTLAAGSAQLASKFGAKLAIVSNSATRAWIFNSWDKMILPKPFSKLCFSISQCIESTEDVIMDTFGEIEDLQAQAGFYV